MGLLGTGSAAAAAPAAEGAEDMQRRIDAAVAEAAEESEESMNDLLVCLGQEEAKVERCPKPQNPHRYPSFVPNKHKHSLGRGVHSRFVMENLSMTNVDPLMCLGLRSSLTGAIGLTPDTLAMCRKASEPQMTGTSPMPHAWTPMRLCSLARLVCCFV